MTRALEEINEGANKRKWDIQGADTCFLIFPSLPLIPKRIKKREFHQWVIDKKILGGRR